MSISIAFKKSFAAIIYYSGIVNLLDMANRNTAVILAYHRVLPKSDPDLKFIQPGMYVSESAFEKQIRFLKENFEIVNLEDIADYSGPKRPCIITFDDGWYDNYKYAFPILLKHDIPATIFLATSFINTNNWPWPDRISYYFHNSSNSNLQKAENLLKIFNIKVNTNIKKVNRFDLVEFVIADLKKLENEMLSEFIKELDSIFSNYKNQLMDKRPWLNWEEINEMKKNKISFGSHTHNHVLLTNTSEEQVRFELNHSKKIIDEKLNTNTKLFCYPNGNYNDNVLKMCKDSGYEIAVTVKRGFVYQKDQNLSLKRFMLHEDMSNTIPMLAAKLTNKIPSI